MSFFVHEYWILIRLIVDTNERARFVFVSHHLNMQIINYKIELISETVVDFFVAFMNLFIIKF